MNQSVSIVVHHCPTFPSSLYIDRQSHVHIVILYFQIFEALYYQRHKGGGSRDDCILIKIFLLTYTYDLCLS